MEFDLRAALKFILPRIFLLLLVFYLIYPQALAVRGSSFILASGIIGMLMYAAHRFPFRKEVIAILAVLGCYTAICFYSMHVNSSSDPFALSFLRSQLAWFFSAYLIVFLIYRVHKRPSFETIIIYIIAAIVLQCICTLLMYFNEGVNEFLYSLQLQTDIDQHKKDTVENERLVGYGTAFFGAGIVAGYGLILVLYMVIKKKMNLIGLLFSGASFALIFYVGMFSARTTIIGFAVSLVTFAVLFLLDNNTHKKQAYKLLVITIGLMSIGLSLCFIYFPDFTDWAFEMFYNYLAGGQLQTSSSNGLIFLIYAPEDFHTFIYGSGSFVFFGPDVGYTRLMFYIGLPGTFMYFAYTFFVAYKSKNKDWTINFLLLVLFIYNLIMNVKGLTDLNMLFYLFFFYFMFYKYYYFYPKVYPIEKVDLTTARDSVNKSITN